MTLNQMINYLTNLFAYCSYVPTNVTNRNQLYSNSVQVPVTHAASIVITFPGYKSIRGNTYDYVVSLNGKNIAHADIMDEIYNQIILSPMNANLMENLLADVSNNWENICLSNYQQLQFIRFTLEEFIECICYISVQEEINYPRQKNYDGYKRPFYSYLEAIYAANGSNLVTYSLALSRCNGTKRFAPLAGIPYNII